MDEDIKLHISINPSLFLGTVPLKFLPADVDRMRPILSKKVLHIQLNWDFWVALREVHILKTEVEIASTHLIL